MRTINLVGIGSMALMLAATAFSAGCKITEGDGVGGAGGEGTTSTTSTGTPTGGEGGSGEGGSGEGGSAACLTCLDAFDPDLDGDVCEGSVDEYDALAACLCEACGATEGDPCYAACNEDAAQDEACVMCGQAAISNGACPTEFEACTNDDGT